MSQPWLKKHVNALELFTIDVIYGRRAGAGPAIYGAFLQVLSWQFNGIAQARWWLYRNRIFHDQPLGCLALHALTAFSGIALSAFVFAIVVKKVRPSPSTAHATVSNRKSRYLVLEICC